MANETYYTSINSIGEQIEGITDDAVFIWFYTDYNIDGKILLNKSTSQKYDLYDSNWDEEYHFENFMVVRTCWGATQYHVVKTTQDMLDIAQIRAEFEKSQCTPPSLTEDGILIVRSCSSECIDNCQSFGCCEYAEFFSIEASGRVVTCKYPTYESKIPNDYDGHQEQTLLPPVGRTVKSLELDETVLLDDGTKIPLSELEVV